MSQDWRNLFKMVCGAGYARAALRSEAQEGLERLRSAGLLELDNSFDAKPKHFTPRYRLTETGRALCRKLSENAA